MSVSNIGLGGSGRVVVTLAACLALLALCACGSQQIFPPDDGGSSSSSGGSGSGSGGSGSGTIIPPGGDSGPCGLIGCFDATVPDTGTGSSGGSSSSSGGMAIGFVPAPDCPGCTTFPPANATPCAGSAPPIRIVYPTDTVLVPPNMNVMSVHWVPNGGYKQYAVDFSNSPNTDWHIITTCQTPTVDAQSGMASGGCEVVVDPVSWSRLVGANRGGQVTITVRGTTDGTCATPSTNQIHLNFAEEDLIGAYYYWQSLIGGPQGIGGNGCLTQGVGGYIYKQIFGDLNGGEVNVTPCPATINAGCNGCHSLSRDGTRMVVYSDDNDSDDEYSDVAGSYLNMTTNPATLYPGGVTQGGGGGGGQPAGFSTIDPNVTALTSQTAQGYYITSNGYPMTGNVRPASRATYGAGAAVPTNGFSVWNGTSGAFINGVTVGAATARPTMPDWSPDGNVVVYVQPAGEFTSWRQDDAHVYGGSLYTVPYTGMGAFGASTLLLQSNGENNYYPSYSPDVPMSWIIFNRVDNMNAGANCNGGFCLDDSFSNPAARLMVLAAPGGPQVPAGGGAAAPIDLEKANGSPVTGKVPWSNSYPRWAPFIQKYKGNPILWFTFSSTRDYGARVINQNNSPNSPALQKSGMYQCYPADAAETPGASHGGGFAPQCQEPQLWMAPLFFSEASGGKDPSGVAFWIPYQKITSHNHTAQWTWVPNTNVPQPPDGGCQCQSVQYGACGAANGGCGCCVGNGYCTGGNTCYTPPM